MATPAQARKKLMAYALGFPEAYEDHPWGEDVVKVNKKMRAAALRSALADKAQSGQVWVLDGFSETMDAHGAEPGRTGVGASCASWRKVVVLSPMGNIRPPPCSTIPSPRLIFRPFRMPATAAAQSSEDRVFSWSSTASRSSASATNSISEPIVAAS